MHELVTDEGVARVGADGVLEFFRDLDGRSVSRWLLWGCDVSVAAPDPGAVTLTVTRKRLPVLSLQVPPDEWAAVDAFAAAVRAAAEPSTAAPPAP